MSKKIILALGLLISISAFADDAPNAPNAANAPAGKWAQIHQEFKAACGNDVKSLCADQKGRRAKFHCIKQNEADGKLSDSCSQFLAEHHHPHGEAPGSNQN